MKVTAGRYVEPVSLWLIGAYVLFIPLETVSGLPEWSYRALAMAELVVTLCFAAEYCLRVWVAERKRDYLLSFWGVLDFVAIWPSLLLPFIGLEELRSLRLLRLARVAKAVHHSRAAQRFLEALRESKEEMTIFAGASGLVLYLASVGIYYFEHEAQPEVFESVFHSLWWSVATLTTVGYGDIYPITTGGRIFTGLILFLGIGVVALPAGIIATALSEARRRERSDG